MSREIPIALLDNLNQPVQYVAVIVRLRLRNGQVLGFAQWDQPITYDHGDGYGPITYSAGQGIDKSAQVADINYSVSNAEGRILTSTTLVGLTSQLVEAGALDDAEWDSFMVDWRNPADGSAVMLDAGDVGEVKVEDGLVIIPELLSYAMRLRQLIGTVWQRPCRAIFGTDANSQTGCGINADELWQSGDVSSVGQESDRTFTGSVAGSYPGRIEFLTGLNAGRRYAIESIDGNSISLAETTPYIIDPSDTYRVRPDCTKLKDGELGCVSYGNWLNFKGEWTIPVGDAVSGAVPGGNIPGGGGWTSEVEVDQQVQ